MSTLCVWLANITAQNLVRLSRIVSPIHLSPFAFIHVDLYKLVMESPQRMLAFLSPRLVHFRMQPADECKYVIKQLHCAPPPPHSISGAKGGQPLH